MNLQTLLTNWNFMRFLRLGIGIYFTVQALDTQSAFAGVVAVFFLFQALTNTGCCGSAGCVVPTKKSNLDNTEEIDFEEIK